MLNSQVMVEHLVINDTHDDILGHVALIQRRMDTDCFGSVRVAGKLNRILVPNPPVGSPGDRAVNLVREVFTIDLVKQSIEIEEAPPGAHYSLPGLTRRLLYLMRIGVNKAPQNRRCFPISALDEDESYSHCWQA